VKILTGNDLVTGDVIWWAGDGWSRQVGDSADVGEQGDDLARTEEAALRVVGHLTQRDLLVVMALGHVLEAFFVATVCLRHALLDDLGCVALAWLACGGQFRLPAHRLLRHLDVVFGGLLLQVERRLVLDVARAGFRTAKQVAHMPAHVAQVRLDPVFLEVTRPDRA
jgi:hypothetical protein